MPLSEHVCCVAVAFKMTEQEEQRICIKFCIKLEHFSTETIWMTRKAFRDNAMSAAQIKVWLKGVSKMMENLLKVTHILEGLQQAEPLMC